MSCKAPLSLSRAPSASVIGAAGGPEDTRRMDPVAALREATEKNVQEAQQELDAAARAEAEAADATQVEANGAAKAREEEAARDRAQKATGPQQIKLPVVEGQALTGGAGAEQTALERGGADPVIPERKVPLHAPTASV